MTAKLATALALLLTFAHSDAPAQTADDLFSDAVLHEIRLVMHPTDWQRLRRDFLDNTYYPCDLHWRGLVVENIGIRSRGLGSRSGTKPGLRVDFDRYESNQKFLGLKSIVLDNGNQDPSLMKERLSMAFFRRMGLVGSREAHTRFYVNNEYIGVYVIVEPVDKAFLARYLGEDSGYLYEYKWVEPYRFEYRGADLSKYSPLPFKPETHEADSRPAPLEAMIRTMNQAPDAEFQTQMAPYMDLKLAVTYLAIDAFVAELDGVLGYEGMNNFYLYRFERGNVSQIIPWDKDNAFRAWDHPILWNADSNVLSRRCLAIPDLRALYMETLLRAAASAGGPGGWLEQEINRAYDQIRASVLEDPTKPYSNELFEQEVNRLRELARLRSDFVQREVAALGFQLNPRLNTGGAINAAPGGGAILAPGSLVSVFGEGLATSVAQATSLPLPTTLSSASILINGVPAPLLFVSPNQVNLQVPWETAAGTASFTANVSGLSGNSITATIGTVSPGVFAVVHADGARVSADRPAAGGDVLLVYANGLGPVTGTVASGAAAPASPLLSTTLTPAITLGGLPAQVLFSGLAPGFAGLYQVNVQLAAATPAGAATPLVITVDGQNSLPTPLATR